jgi:hypothetical protein
MAAREAASPSGRGPLTGFTGGLFKVATAPLMVPGEVLKGSVQKNILYGSTIGLIRGVGKGVSNVVGGTVQAISSAIPPNPLELVTRKLAYIQAAKGL